MGFFYYYYLLLTFKFIIPDVINMLHRKLHFFFLLHFYPLSVFSKLQIMRANMDTVILGEKFFGFLFLLLFIVNIYC